MYIFVWTRNLNTYGLFDLFLQVGYETGYPNDGMEISFLQYFKNIMTDLEFSLGLW